MLSKRYKLKLLLSNNEDPNQTDQDYRSNLIWVCTFCPHISVKKTDDNYSNLKSINTNTPHFDKSVEMCNELNLNSRFLKKQVLVK